MAQPTHKIQPKTKTVTVSISNKDIDSLTPIENILTVAVVENEKVSIEKTTEQAQSKVVLTEGSTLVLNAEEVNEKYLHKKNSEGDATSENKKSSTLQRLLSKVSDLKHNQDPFGELRQKKNEILALNLKSEKQRNQNR
jgi:hypothetical protein